MAYKQMSPMTFLYDLSKISMKAEKCGKIDLLCLFLDALVKRHTH